MLLPVLPAGPRQKGRRGYLTIGYGDGNKGDRDALDGTISTSVISAAVMVESAAPDGDGDNGEVSVINLVVLNFLTKKDMKAHIMDVVKLVGGGGPEEQIGWI